MIDLEGKHVGVTGSQGFIGKYLCKILEDRGAIVFGFEDKKVLPNVHETIKYLMKNKINYVIHLAGYNGGIAFNYKHPADVFATNTILALNIIAAAAYSETKKILSVITSCSYPEHPYHLEDRTWYPGRESDPPPYKEDWLHNGSPNESVACHGYAKRNLEIASRMYRKQYRLNAIVACPNTVYGPGDRTDPDRTKVMTALIKKFIDAKKSNTDFIECWGTGSPKREFIYVTDTAEMLVRALENYEEEVPLNISTGQEYSIKELSELIAKKVEYQGEIRWDISKPDGAMRKALDVTRMKKYLGEYNFTPIEKGIEETIMWYNSIL